MKIIYNLVKKDYLLIKKSLFIMLLFVIFAPIFISMRAPEFQNNGTLLYGMLVLMITFMTYHMISMEEINKGFLYLQITLCPIKKWCSKIHHSYINLLSDYHLYWAPFATIYEVGW